MGVYIEELDIRVRLVRDKLTYHARYKVNRNPVNRHNGIRDAL
jgi:hypothetical protein